jgi:hypothetical protein
MRSLIAVVLILSLGGCVPSHKFVDRKTMIIPNYLINGDSLLVYRPLVTHFFRSERVDTIASRIQNGLQSRLGLSRNLQELKTTCLACTGNYLEKTESMEIKARPREREFMSEVSCLDSCLYVPPNKHGLFIVIDPEQIIPVSFDGPSERWFDKLALRIYILRGDEIVYFRHYRSIILSRGEPLRTIYGDIFGRNPVWPDYQVEYVLQAVVEDLRKRLY